MQDIGKKTRAPDQNPVSFDRAVELLRAGEICAFATETVYGLGADATNCNAVLKIYAAKQRPRFNPLIVHCAGPAMARRIAQFSPLAEKLSALWPGPLTLVLPLNPGAGICDLVSAGLATIAVRVPAHQQAQNLIRELGRPLAAPSANPSGRLSATTAGQVRLMFGDKVPVLAGEPCTAGIESTILTVAGDTIVQLRAGALPRRYIEQQLGVEIAPVHPDAKISAPGMLASHYAPRATLRLNATGPQRGEAFLGFGNVEAPPSTPAHLAKNLSASADCAEAAHNFFSLLHQLDASGASSIAVAPIPQTGLGEAINERLKRAAAPRSQN